MGPYAGTSEVAPLVNVEEPLASPFGREGGWSTLRVCQQPQMARGEVRCICFRLSIWESADRRPLGRFGIVHPQAELLRRAGARFGSQSSVKVDTILGAVFAPQSFARH